MCIKTKNLFHALEGPRHVDAEANEGHDEKHAADEASLEAVPVIPVVEVGLRVRDSDLVQVTTRLALRTAMMENVSRFLRGIL